MTESQLLFLQPSCRAAGGGRFRLALAVSAFFHLLIAAALVSDFPYRNINIVGAAPIAARLESLQTVVPANTAVSAKEEPMKQPSRRISVISEGGRRDALIQPVSARTQDAAQPLIVPQMPDPTVYAARDLDSYPRPLVPLDIERFVDRAAGIPPAGI